MVKNKLTPEEIDAFNKLNEEALNYCSGGKGRPISIVVGTAVLLLLSFFWLPAFNLHDPTLYKTFVVALAVYCLMRVATSGFYKPTRNLIQTARFLIREERVAVVSLILILLIWGGGMLLSSPVFFARQYHDLLEVVPGNFSEEVETIPLDHIPITDEQSAAQLGNRALGELSDLVSQFEVDSSYSQINLHGSPFRVASLKYGNFFKWLSNNDTGLPGYVTVDMLTQTASVVRYGQGIHYSDSEPFFRNISRFLRLKYPTCLFDSVHLEIDEAGQLWWICPRMVRTIGLFGGENVEGAVLVRADTGESEYYPLTEIPQWVDQVFDSNLILRQYNWYGKYGQGFLNSVFSQSGVTTATDGANFITVDDDVYLYTGITSSGADQSNVGFILCNQRTKQTRFYAVSGATEQSAQLSAQGAVQNLGYTASFPLLLNISGEPTYFMALKDSANLVKRYAMVNVSQYQLVAVGPSVEECQMEYVSLLEAHYNPNQVSASLPAEEIEGTITDIRENVIDGNTFYYVLLDNAEGYFSISAKTLPQAVLLDLNQRIRVTYTPNSPFAEVQSLTFLVP